MSRGRLRVLLGAAPGVGKTYAMLEERARLAAEGTDVVIAVVETHGRAATAAMIQGLEIIPRRETTHRGVRLDEMDLDAVIARRPAVALVDELAHTNVPASANEKLWQDVEALLDAGIDVISTVRRDPARDGAGCGRAPPIRSRWWTSPRRPCETASPVATSILRNGSTLP